MHGPDRTQLCILFCLGSNRSILASQRIASSIALVHPFVTVLHTQCGRLKVKAIAPKCSSDRHAATDPSKRCCRLEHSPTALLEFLPTTAHAAVVAPDLRVADVRAIVPSKLPLPTTASQVYLGNHGIAGLPCQPRHRRSTLPSTASQVCHRRSTLAERAVDVVSICLVGTCKRLLCPTSGHADQM